MSAPILIVFILLECVLGMPPPERPTSFFDLASSGVFGMTIASDLNLLSCEHSLRSLRVLNIEAVIRSKVLVNYEIDASFAVDGASSTLHDLNCVGIVMQLAAKTTLELIDPKILESQGSDSSIWKKLLYLAIKYAFAQDLKQNAISELVLNSFPADDLFTVLDAVLAAKSPHEDDMLCSVIMAANLRKIPINIRQMLIWVQLAGKVNAPIFKIVWALPDERIEIFQTFVIDIMYSGLMGLGMFEMSWEVFNMDHIC